MTNQQSARAEAEREADDMRRRWVAVEAHCRELERERDEALDNHRKTYANSVELRKHLEKALERCRELEQALRMAVEDADARWDMHDPRTNPGIREWVEHAKSVLTADTNAH